MGGVGRGGLHFSGILIAALFFAAWLLEEPPLVGDRPAPGDYPKSLAGQAQDVPARLWEDPFEAVMKHRKELAAVSGRPRKASSRPGQGQELEMKWVTPGRELAVRVRTEHDGKAKAPTDSGTAQSAAGARHACEGGPKADAEHDAAGPLGRVLDQAGRRVEPDPSGIDFVFVSMSGSHWAEAKEARLRARYALLTSLLEQGYEPLETEHIGYWCFRLPSLRDTDRSTDGSTSGPDGQRDAGPRGQESGSDEGARLIIPFEAFMGPVLTNNGKDTRLALLLWVPEGDIQQRPIKALKQLSRALLRSLERRGQGGSGGFGDTLTYIGPQSSGTLANLFRELCEPNAEAPSKDETTGGKPNALPPLRILSSNATGATRELMPTDCCTLGLKNGDEKPVRYADLRKTHGVELLRSIVTDDEVMRLAVQELRLRNVDPLPKNEFCETGGKGGRGDKVVIISELDTAYGRALPKAFVAALCEKESEHGKQGNREKTPPNVLEYGYMRGLDGLVGKPDAGNGDPQKAADLRTLTEHMSESYIEPAVGRSQFDYLRRMANLLHEKDKELRGRGEGGIRAFGILGNDFYDKLLVLQALREHFPDHHYFTNDLDARLLDPADYPAVRNLIVLSSFNLRLAEPWQQRVPPFRSHYQTSLFLAARLIGAEPLEKVGDLLVPQVFEVGRGRFFRLKTPDAGPRSDKEASAEPSGLENCLQSEEACPGLNPPPWEHADPLAGRYLVSGVAAVFLLIVALLIVPGDWGWAGAQVAGVKNRFLRVRGTGKPRGYLAVPPFWLRVLLPMAGVLWVMYLAMGTTLEPFALASGVSIWPAELIRTLAGFVALYLIYLARNRLEDCDRALEQDFVLPLHKDDDSDVGIEDRTNVGAVDGAQGQVAAADGLSGGLRGFLTWVNARRRLARRSELELQIRRLRTLLCAGRHTRNGDQKDPRTAGEQGTAKRDAVNFDATWRHYRVFSSRSARNRQAWLVVLVLFIVTAFLTVHTGLDRIHTHRAPLPEPDWLPTLGHLWDFIVRWWPEINGLVFLAIPFGLLVVRVLQEVLICNRLVKEVMDISLLQNGVWRSFCPGRVLDTRENYLLTVFFIARRTEATSDVVWYPLLVWILVILSMNTRFDNIEPAAGILFMLALALLLSLAPLFLLRRAARWVRDSILEGLKNDVFSARREKAETPGEASQVVIDRIEELQIGAFRPWYQEPVMQVLFWLVSFGALVITEYLRSSA